MRNLNVVRPPWTGASRGSAAGDLNGRLSCQDNEPPDPEYPEPSDKAEVLIVRFAK